MEDIIIVFKIFRSFHSVSGARASHTDFHYWWLFSHYFMTNSLMGDQTYVSERIIGIKQQ